MDRGASSVGRDDRIHRKTGSKDVKALEAVAERRFSMATIKTITDPQELLQAQIDEVHIGNLAMREKIKNYRAILKAGEQAERQLRAELKALKATGKVGV
jgi:hypothetical protein